MQSKQQRDSRDDELLRRIDEHTSDEPTETTTLEQRLRLALPGHAMFRAMADDVRAKLLTTITGTDAPDGMKIDWTSPREKWSIACVQDNDGLITAGILCEVKEGINGGKWCVEDISIEKFFDVLRVLGAIRES